MLLEYFVVVDIAHIEVHNIADYIGAEQEHLQLVVDKPAFVELPEVVDIEVAAQLFVVVVNNNYNFRYMVLEFVLHFDY